jgi:nitroimidazol reductase NimA-like FMN-containing flavoprotein (pyridoxamine 5'-phosphate oxidase superfamily)
MTTTTSGAARRMKHLDDRECWARLRSAQLGRLAYATPDRIAIVPLNAVVRGRSVLFRTADDADLLTEQPLPVSFEVDGWDASSAWSVIACGALRPITDAASLQRESEIGQVPWAPEEDRPRSVLVELAVDRLEGREFSRRRWQNPRWYW